LRRCEIIAQGAWETSTSEHWWPHLPQEVFQTVEIMNVITPELVARNENFG
jgi:hypothetical protein